MIHRGAASASISVSPLYEVYYWTMAFTLYYHPLASFCWKVLIALYETGTEFEPRIIDLSDAVSGAELRAIWPIGKFPVIRDSARGRDLPESSIIIDYIDHHSTSEVRLIPRDWYEALDVRLWDRFFDQYVHAPMQKIVGDRLRPTGHDFIGIDEARALLRHSYEMVERRIQSRRWIAGNSFSMADCAAAPALFYAAIIAPFPAEFTALADYFERLVDRPSFTRVIAEARPYFQYFPFADAIPARFL
jgi:glutathione S-transferase